MMDFILFLIQIITIVGFTTCITSMCTYHIVKKLGDHSVARTERAKKSTYDRLTTYDKDIQFLEYVIIFQLEREFKYYRDVLGYKNLNTEAITRCMVVITKRAYASLSQDYKLVLLQYFSPSGLETYISDRIEMSITKYVQDHNLL